MPTYDRVGGMHVLVDASVDALARVGGMHVLVDASADALARVGGIVLLVDAVLVADGSPTMARWRGVPGMTPGRALHGSGRGW